MAGSGIVVPALIGVRDQFSLLSFLDALITRKLSGFDRIGLYFCFAQQLLLDQS